jgi:DNA repair protein RadC
MFENKKLNIKQWADEDRPREKLMNKGTQSLSDAELIAILLGSGSRDLTAVELAKHMLNNAGNNLGQLGKKTVRELMHFKGIGEAKAITLIAAMELGRRRKVEDLTQRKKITASRDVFEIFQPMLCDIPYEEFWVVFLNKSNKVIDKIKISQGGISATVIDVRLILKYAIERLASSIVLCHNHPSGNLQPSEADKKITRQLKDASKLMDISVLDHIIVTETNYYSFLDEGFL